MRVTSFTPKPETLAYNLRIAKRIQLFREIRGLDQKDLYDQLGYTSGGWSMIESGKRGLNKTKLKKAADILGTYPEILTTTTELSKEELVDLDRFLKIRKNHSDPRLESLLSIIRS